MPTRKNIPLLVAGTIVITVLAIVTLLYFLNQKILSSKKTTTPLDTDISSNLVPQPTTPPEKGFLEGSLSFPSEGIPTDMKVCAENLQGQTIACTDSHIKDSKYTFGEGYLLEAPIGQYRVYANTNDILFYKAYYSEFVTCGLSVNCTSHKPIVVEVKKGETTKNIDPQDWYNQKTPAQ